MSAIMKKRLIIAATVLIASLALTYSGPFSSMMMLHPNQPGLTFCYEVFTCHLVHWTPEHLLYDLLCFVIMAVMLDTRKLLITVFISAVTISLTVCLTHPDLAAYCGLSGINCALFTVYAIDMRKQSKLLSYAAILGIVLKTAFEFYTGRTYFATSGFIPIHEAHIAGILTGARLLLGSTLYRLCRTRLFPSMTSHYETFTVSENLNVADDWSSKGLAPFSGPERLCSYSFQGAKSELRAGSPKYSQYRSKR